MNPEFARSTTPTLREISFVLLLSVASIFPFLGFVDVYQVSEGREGVVVNTILDQRSYVLPLRHAELVPSKPPLYHWLTAGAAHAFGEFREFELRFVSACAACLLSLVILFAGNRFFGRSAGVIAATIFLTTLGVLRLAVDGRVDMLFGFLSSTAVLHWLSAYQQVRSSGGIASTIESSVWRNTALLSGLAILAKGPLGLVLPILVIGGALLSEEGWRSLRELFRKSWIWTAVVCVPWYVAATVVGHAAFLSRQLFFENLQRFVGGQGITRKPVYFYLVNFWEYALPWSIVVLWLLFALLVRRLKRTEQPSLPVDDSIRRGFRFCAVWIVAVLALLTASSGKRTAYLLLISPAMSLALACVFLHLNRKLEIFSEEWSSRRSVILRSGRVVLLVLFLLGIFPFALRMIPGVIDLFSFSVPLLRELHGLVDAVSDGPRLLAGSISMLLLSAALLWERGFRLERPAQLLLAALLAGQCMFVVYANLAHAMKAKTHGMKQIARRVDEVVPADQQLTFVKKKRDEHYDGFFFYLRRNVQLFEPSKDESALRPETAGWYLARGGWLDEQPDTWTARVQTVLRGGRRVDADRPDEEVVLFRLREKAAIEASEEYSSPPPNGSEILSSSGATPAANPSDPPAEKAVDESQSPVIDSSVAPEDDE